MAAPHEHIGVVVQFLMKDGSIATSLTSGLEASFEEVLGKIIADWSRLEQELNKWVEIFLTSQGDKSTNCRRSEASKRIRLLSDYRSIAFDNFEDLNKSFHEIENDIWKAKLVRDYIAHWEIRTLDNGKEKYITNPEKKSKSQKKYFEKDFWDISAKITYSAGRLWELINMPGESALSNLSKEKIRSILVGSQHAPKTPVNQPEWNKTN